MDGHASAAATPRAGWPPRPAGLRARLSTLLDLGLASYAGRTRRRLKTLNALAYLIAVLSAVYALIYALDDPERYAAIIAINLVLVAVGVAVPFSHRLHELAGALLIAVAESAALFGLAAALGREAGIQLNLVVGAAAAFMIFGPERRALVAATVVYCCLLHLAAWFAFPPERALVAIDPGLANQLYVSSAVTAFGVIAALVWHAFTLVERAEAQTEALLRKILPDAVVERLKAAPERLVADAYPEASVLFADLKDFVPLSRRLGAQATVVLLNDLMSALDALAARHGVERIKTVGDAYMAVAGVPVPAHDHARRIAGMALDIAGAVAAVGRVHGTALTMRVGLACGPVMAGVTGERRISFDVWGDCVNLAARLQAAAEPGRIHLSAEMAQALAGAFPVAPCGLREIKGIGNRETWCLEESRPG